MTLLSSLTLRRATPEQVLISRNRHFPQWGGKLNLEQYLARDAQLDPLEHAADGNMITWVLVPREDPSTPEFLCSCETFRRNALVGRERSSAPEEAVGYAIASVFTPPANRRKGYAKHMLMLLHWIIAPRSALPSTFPPAWGEPPPAVNGCGNASFSVLYSDIGHDFYTWCGPDGNQTGWMVRDPVNTVWKVPLEEDIDAQDNFKWLNEEEVYELWDEDARRIKSDLAKVTSPHGILCTFLPNNGVGAFQIRRSFYFLPGMDLTIPTKWGVSLPSGGGDPIFATWVLDLSEQPPAFIISRLRATKETFPILIGKALEAAREYGFPTVEIWNLPEELEDAASAYMAGETKERALHLPSFLWYGKEVQRDVHWMFNEKFCWC